MYEDELIHKVNELKGLVHEEIQCGICKEKVNNLARLHVYYDVVHRKYVCSKMCMDKHIIENEKNIIVDNI